MLEQTHIKAINAKQCDALNTRLSKEWDAIRKPLLDCMLPHDTLHKSMQAAGCQLTATDLGLDNDFYREAVKGARYIRDRYSMLDMVDDSVGLAGFIKTMPV